MNYILDENKNPVKVPDTSEGYAVASAFCADFNKNYRVASTDFPVFGKDARVSTVFLGIDHSFSAGGPPILWETMVFDIPGFEYECERYTSHADAVAGHAAMVARVKAGPWAIEPVSKDA